MRRLLPELAVGATLLLLAVAFGVDVVDAVSAGREVPLDAALLAGAPALLLCRSAGAWLYFTAGTSGARLRRRLRPSRVGFASLDVDGDKRLRVTGDVAALFAPGYVVYVHRDVGGRCLYVGRSVDPGRRTRQHMRDKHWATDIADIEMHRFATFEDMRAAERDLIVTLRPAYNKIRFESSR